MKPLIADSCKIVKGLKESARLAWQRITTDSGACSQQTVTSTHIQCLVFVMVLVVGVDAGFPAWCQFTGMMPVFRHHAGFQAYEFTDFMPVFRHDAGFPAWCRFSGMSQVR